MDPPVFDCFVNEAKQLCVGTWNDDGKSKGTLVLSAMQYYRDQFVDSNSMQYTFFNYSYQNATKLFLDPKDSRQRLELEQMSELETSSSSI